LYYLGRALGEKEISRLKSLLLSTYEIILSEADSSNVRAERDLRSSLDQNYRFAVEEMEQGERRSKVNSAGSWKAWSPSLPVSRNVTAACWPCQEPQEGPLGDKPVAVP